MYIVLDGVFNHIGSQSLYFNVDGYYSTLGAGQSKESPYYDWFRFKSWPNEYDSWWGFKTLPAVEETNKDYVNYIMDGEDSIVRRWLRAGASGWRLDVADELPDEFIAKIRSAMEETKEDTLLIGEVWDDGTTKIAYDQRRKYLLGSETHGLMNYPLRTALLNYLRGGDADEFREAVETLRENYPKEAFYSCMNLLGTHDTPRLLTMLGSDQLPKERKDQAAFKLSPQQRSTALALLRCAETILYAFPGSPMLYYGDEAGMEGCQDPFNRGCYPWGKEDHRLLSFFRRLGELRNQEACLQDGELHWLFTSGPLLAFAREKGDRRIVTAVNRDAWRHSLTIPWKGKIVRDLISGKEFETKDGFVELILEARGAMMLA
jgi:4-alpha-glucanotransferase